MPLLCARAALPASGSLAAVNAAPPASPSTNALGPRIRFATQEPNFGQVTKGDTVKYTFIFTNTGDQVLHLLKVQPGCGCTQAGEWTKAVEPGKTGVIPIQLATAHFQGDITKFVTVLCDDKTLNKGAVLLQLKGHVWTPVEAQPQYLNFGIPPDAPGGSGFISLTNHLPEPVYVSQPKSSNPAFTVELRTNAPGYRYQLVVSRVPPLSPGMAQTVLTLNTTATNEPVLTAYAWANVQAPVTLYPAQLTLPPPPLTNPVPLTIILQNATTNLMALSDPAVNAKEVKVQLRELQRGRYFNALLTFPPGFTIAPGEHVAFTVKSTLPKHPLLTVPIVQSPKPVAAPPVPGPQAATAPRSVPEAH